VSAATFPLRILFKINRPGNGKDVISTFVVYALILMALSGVFLTIWHPSQDSGQAWYLWPFGYPPGISPNIPPDGEDPNPIPGEDETSGIVEPSASPAPPTGLSFIRKGE
jgi:hypothetical protein